MTRRLRDPGAVYLRHADGATRVLQGRPLSRLRRAIAAGAGQPEIVALLDAGYTGWIADDGEVYEIDAIAEAFAARTE